MVCLLSNFHPILKLVLANTDALAPQNTKRTPLFMNIPKKSGHFTDTEDIVILDHEERWFERGVREAIWERVEKPSLNKHGASVFNNHTLGTNH